MRDGKLLGRVEQMISAFSPLGVSACRMPRDRASIIAAAIDVGAD
jgi:hypothetical protein